MSVAQPLTGKFAHRPAPAWRRRLQAWLDSRRPRTDHLQLSQRNVFILPTGAGWALALTLAVLLVAAINYQINLGYLLTFLLAGSALAGMVTGHSNLRGTALQLRAPQSGFVGQPCPLEVVLHNTRRTPRWGLGLRFSGQAPAKALAGQWAFTDVAAQASASVELACTLERRGLQHLPSITVQTRYPLGSFRVWAVWRTAARIWIYPSPEVHPPPLPAASPEAGGRSPAQARHGEELDGVRAYQRGDPLKLVVWKKAAQSFASGSANLVSRDRPQAHHHRLWLDAAATGLADPEARLSRLTAWVLLAHQLHHSWGLRLPNGQEIAPDQGLAHMHRCLQALAACP